MVYYRFVFSMSWETPLKAVGGNSSGNILKRMMKVLTATFSAHFCEITNHNPLYETTSKVFCLHWFLPVVLILVCNIHVL